MPKGKLNKRYTPEFKQLVVETIGEEKLNYSEAGRRWYVANGGEYIFKKGQRIPE